MGWDELFKQDIGGYKIVDYDINVLKSKKTEKAPKEESNPLNNKRITKRSNTIRLN